MGHPQSLPGAASENRRQLLLNAQRDRAVAYDAAGQQVLEPPRAGRSLRVKCVCTRVCTPLGDPAAGPTPLGHPAAGPTRQRIVARSNRAAKLLPTAPKSLVRALGVTDVLKRWLAWTGGASAWLGALTVLAIAVVLVALDITIGSVHRYWSRHSFTSSVLSGLLVVLLTVLIVDRVIRFRQLRNQSRAIAAQAAAIAAQAKRAADAVTSPSTDDRQAGADELRTYTLMLFTSAPVLIDANVSRTFLETAQRVAAQLSRALRATGNEQNRQAKARLDDGVQQLERDAAPLIGVLNREQRAAVSSE